MGSPKNVWYYFVDKLIKSRYYTQDYEFARRLDAAMQEARKETAKLPNGDLRLIAIDEILIKKVKTYEGVGEMIHYDARTVQKWINSYVNLVGRKAGL